MSVFHSCGHEDKYRPISGWPITLKGETCDSVDGYVKCVEYMTVCHTCYLKYVTYYPDDILFNDWEHEQYFNE